MRKMTDEELLSSINEIAEKHRNPNYHIGGINLSAIIQSMIVTGIIGLYIKIDVNTQKSIQREVQIENITDDISDIKKGMEKNTIKLDNFRSIPNYSRENLKEDLLPIERKLNSIEKDIEMLKRKVD